MEEEIVNEQLKRFVKDHIASVAQLEILLLLRSNPQQKWLVDQIVHELRTDASGTRQQLGFLCQHSMIQGDDSEGYFFAPADEEVLANTAALAQAYRLRRVAVVGLIFGGG